MSSSRSTPSAVLFDMDGVLVDSTSAHLRAWASFLDENGIPPPPEGIPSLFGRPASEAVRLLLRSDVDDAEIEAKLTTLHRYADALLDEHAPGELVVPGAHRLVEELLAAGRQIAIVTSARCDTAERSLGELRHHVEVVVTAEDVQRGKPDPEPYLTAASRLAVPPDACVVVEDAVVGVQAGRHAGMDVIAVATTAASDALRAAGARVVVGDVTELHPVLLPAADHRRTPPAQTRGGTP